jgi:pyrroline-5-carboxylate reductase
MEGVLHRQVLMTTEEMAAAAVRLGLSHAEAIRLVQDAWRAGRLVWAGMSADGEPAFTLREDVYIKSTGG